MSGFRQATRDPRYIPANKQPTGRKQADRLVKYFDFGRNDWRSVRRLENISVIISAFWNEKDKVYVDTPEQAGLDGSKIFETPATDGTKERRSQTRERVKRQKQIEKQQNRRNR